MNGGGSPSGPPAPVPGRGEIRVALLHADAAARASLVAGLERHDPGLLLEVVAASWPELVQSAAFPTELVLLELEPTGPVSIEARVRSCRAAGAVVVAIGEEDAPGLRERAAALGAAGFVARTTPPAEVAALAREVAGTGGEASWRPAPGGALARPRLSPGERRALELYASGLSTLEVGRAMNVQYETAKTYLRRVREKYAKVGRPASKKIELIRRATEDGILE